MPFNMIFESLLKKRLVTTKQFFLTSTDNFVIIGKEARLNLKIMFCTWVNN